MKILLILLLCATTIFAQPAERYDTKFAALVIWYQQLASVSDQWNDTFMSKNPNSEDAQQIRAVLNEQFKFFIECANRYSAEGPSCDAQLRYRVMQHDIETMKWQLAYGGRALSDNEQSRALGASKKLKDESTQLKKEVDACFAEQKL